MVTRPLTTGAATVVAAAALAYGGWSLVRVLSTPAPQPVVFAALAPAPAPAASGSDAAAPLVPLAAVFGSPDTFAQPDPPEPEPMDMAPEGQPWEDDFFDETVFSLRGVIVGEDGAFAILETPDGTQVVREGTILPGGEEIMTIGPDSLELLVDDEVYSISFTDDMMDPMSDDWNDLDAMR